MKRMLINATHQEELRVAIVDGQRLVDLDIEHKSREQRKSNIYKAKITRVEPSLEAVFVDYGSERHGFLPFKEIAKEFFRSDYKKPEGGGRPNIRDCVKEGQEIVVQIEKEERSNKGAALTTFVSLAGRFLVLMPNNPRAGGVSRRIEGDDRSELKAAMSDVEVADGMGTIVRTAGIGRTTEELQWDLDYQAAIWSAIQEAAGEKKAPFLIYQESNIIVRGLRDYFRGDIGEIITDEQDTFNQAAEFIKLYMPQNERKLKLYQDDVPLFNRYQVESQIESAFRREVRLPSGGALVIDHTEALISIDINSARATKGHDIEETATNTNLEAADEVARQLRLRDLGGLVVIDFIDMMASKHQRAVENRLREALKQDRARVQIGRISKFGLLEMSRQRLRPSLGESSENVCPRCHGHGTIRGIESTALSILRLVEEEAMKDNTGRVLADVPVEVATYLLNEKRQSITEIEARNSCTLLIVANTSIETPNYTIERIRMTEADHEMVTKKSYELVTDTTETYSPQNAKDEKRVETAAVGTVAPLAPAPTPAKRKAAAPAQAETTSAPGGIRRIFGAVSSLFGVSSPATAEADASTAEAAPARGRGGKNDNGDGSRNQNRNKRSGSKTGRGRNRQDGDKSESSTEARSGGRKNAKRNKSADGAEGERKNGRNVSKNSTDTGDSATDEKETTRAPRSRGRGRGRKQDKNNQAETTTETDGVTDATAGNIDSSTADQDAANTDNKNAVATDDSSQEQGSKSRGRRGGRRRGGRGRGRGAERNSESAEVETNDASSSETQTHGTEAANESTSAPAVTTTVAAAAVGMASAAEGASPRADASATSNDSIKPVADVSEAGVVTKSQATETASQPAQESNDQGEEKPRVPRRKRTAPVTSEASDVGNTQQSGSTDYSDVSATSAVDDDDNKPKRRGGGRRRERVNSKKAAAQADNTDGSAEASSSNASSPAVLETGSSSAANEPMTSEPPASEAPKAAVTPKVESAPKAAPAPKADAAPKAESAPKAAPAPKADAAPRAESSPKASPAQKADAPPKAESTPKASPAPKADAAPKAESAPKAAPAPKADAAPRAESTPKASPAPKADAAPQAESTPKAASAPKADAAPQAESTPKAVPASKADVAPKAEAAPKAAPAPKVDAAPKAKTAPKAAPAAKADATPKAEATLKSAETKNAPTAKTESGADEAKVSQRQPSELKSSVRSLAGKEERPSGGLSFASKKVADVVAPTPAKAVESKPQPKKEVTASSTEKAGE